MQILNIAGYKFIPLIELENLRSHLLDQTSLYALKGTILLSKEGINLSLAGDVAHINAFLALLTADERFSDMRFHQTYSETIPFKRLKVKIKKEIITLNQPAVDAVNERAPSISPEDFKRWLDEQKEVTILDTRNDYEIAFGAFQGAKNLRLDDFSEFPETLETIDKDKPIVMYCTGGIRCEKAAIYMLQQGYENVFQLDGGILGYFAKVGGAHYQGECFVFDERVAVDANLEVKKN